MMKHFYMKILLLVLIFGSLRLTAQKTLTIKADSYQQQYEGVGASTGLHLGDFFKMSQAEQEKAAQVLNGDLNMAFVQTYVYGDPRDPSTNYDVPIKYIQLTKSVRPDNKVSLVFDNYPGYLRKAFVTPSGETEMILDFERPGIYDEVAQWYFNVLKEFQENDIVVDILCVSNEPNFNRKYHYGYGDPRVGLAYVLKEAIPKLKAMLNNSDVNTTNLKTPEIMGPSTISTGGCRNYIDFWLKNYPEAYEQIDIVSTHQYGGGTNGKIIRQIRSRLNGKKFYQNEQHGYHSDNLGLDSYSESLIGKQMKTCLDFAALFDVALNNGVNAWYYFQATNKKNYASSSLVRARYDGLSPYKQYYAFKQVTSTQPLNSHVLEWEETGGVHWHSISAFRKEKSNKVYLNLSNFTDQPETVTITLENANEIPYLIKSVQTTTTDAKRDAVAGEIERFEDKSVNSYTITTDPFSVNTLAFKIQKSSIKKSQDKIKGGNEVFLNDQEDGIIISSSKGNNIKTIQVFSFNGEELKRIENTTNSNSIYISNLKKGLYIVRVNNGHGQVFVKKIKH